MSKRSLTPPPIGFSPLDADLTQFIGKAMNLEVALVYHELGGTEAMTDWARQNQTDFYTKLVPRIMEKRIEHTASNSVEEMLARLDTAEKTGLVIEGECTDVDEEE
jgi:hypothetical protein